VERRTVGFEALARWTSPDLGSVRPDYFIRLAEAAGLINRITIVLLEKTLKEARLWPHDLYVSFNLSGHDLMNNDAIDAIIAVVDNSGIDSRRVEFEITETALMSDFAQARASIDRLAALGCRIALDDFGSGYSSFSYMHNLPVNKIKIDRAFVVEMLKGDVARKIVGTILDLAANLGMECVVEGVETEAEVAVLRKMNGRYIQGYLFGRPMPASEISGFCLRETLRKAVPEPVAAISALEAAG